MQRIANRVSMWTTILGAPTVASWYLGHIHMIPLSAGSNEALLGIAVGLVVIALIANAIAHSRLAQPSGSQTLDQGATATATPTQTQTTNTSGQFRNVDEFYQTYSSRMLTETEALVRAESDHYQPGTDRERFLVRIAAMLVTVLIFERAWLSIFGSQLRALHQLNIGMRTYDEMHGYYDEAVTALPDFYKKVSFETWLAFLKSWFLVREYDSTHLEITVRGQDFLRYLVECRYDQATRPA